MIPKLPEKTSFEMSFLAVKSTRLNQAIYRQATSENNQKRSL